MSEEWRLVVECADYSISSLGRVRRETIGSFNTWPGKVLSQCFTRDGYLYVGLVINGRQRQRMVHALVAEAWHGPRPTLPVRHMVNHMDGVKTNNFPENLEWVTQQGNEVHARLNGLKGRLVPSQVLEIRGSKEGQVTLGRKFGIDGSTVSRIRTGKLYRYVV